MWRLTLQMGPMSLGNGNRKSPCQATESLGRRKLVVNYCDYAPAFSTVR